MIAEPEPMPYRVSRSPGDRYVNLRAPAVFAVGLVAAMMWWLN